MKIQDNIKAKEFVKHLKDYNLIVVDKDYWRLIQQYKSLSQFMADCIVENNISYADFSYALQNDLMLLAKTGARAPKVLIDIKKHDGKKYQDVIAYIVDNKIDIKDCPRNITKDIKHYVRCIDGTYDAWDEIFKLLY